MQNNLELLMILAVEALTKHSDFDPQNFDKLKELGLKLEKSKLYDQFETVNGQELFDYAVDILNTYIEKEENA